MADLLTLAALDAAGFLSLYDRRTREIPRTNVRAAPAGFLRRIMPASRRAGIVDFYDTRADIG
ncbi:hypothetical protein [Nocardia cyriacigeorgica]|uniref:hypothetical protein n=1 Tax=Nocardia cyriacigeorgica TaxID=135487 RepID=UPI0013D581CF|nr:hypothetical protein [Nocardia cyriacigeorgica]NEW26044.1 hypothetical protein [Nocardia cyriacigeorgica]